EADLSVGKAKSFSAQSHLSNGFLARKIDRLAAAPRQMRRDLKQEGRFADARFATNEYGRARHDAAARHAVEFGNAAREARRFLGRALQCFELDDAALALPRDAGTGWRTGVRFLDEGIPAVAGGTLARPARRRGPTRLADVERFRELRHELHRVIQI